MVFINSVNNNDVISFLNSKPISKTIIKLWETKIISYVIDVILFIKLLIAKISENFIVDFVRKIFKYNLKNYKFEKIQNLMT